MNFQLRVFNWMQACFGADDTASVKQRAWRMLEEANELAQACGVTKDEAHQLVNYVQGRPVGEADQEAGGVMLTMAGLCCALDLDMDHAGEVELNRCWVNLPKIQAKNATKKADSALPSGIWITNPDEPPRSSEGMAHVCDHGVLRGASCQECNHEADSATARANAIDAAIEDEAWQMYCDDNRNNPLAISTWAALPGQVRLRYIGRVISVPHPVTPL